MVASGSHPAILIPSVAGGTCHNGSQQVVNPQAPLELFDTRVEVCVTLIPRGISQARSCWMILSCIKEWTAFAVCIARGLLRPNALFGRYKQYPVNSSRCEIKTLTHWRTCGSSTPQPDSSPISCVGLPRITGSSLPLTTFRVPPGYGFVRQHQCLSVPLHSGPLRCYLGLSTPPCAGRNKSV